MKKLILLLLFISAQPSILNAAPRSRLQIARVWPRLDRASRGYRVRFVQYLLKHRGFYKGKVDWYFGPQTERAVRAFQRSKGLKVDGVVGSQTWEKLIVPLKRGDRGDAVRAVQIFFGYVVSEIGDPKWKTSFNGIFDASTEKVVRISQKEDGLKVDGIIGAQTWCKFVGGSVGGH